MTKNELADGVILTLGYNNQDKKLDRRLVWFWADRLLPMLIDNYAKKMRLDISEALENFITVKEAEVKYNTRRKGLYADLPTAAMDYPGYSTVRQVGDIQDETHTFVVLKNGEQAVIKHLEVGDLNGRIGYRLEGDRMWFVNMPDGDYQYVLVKYVPTVTDLTEQDSIPIPSVVEYDLITMIVGNLQEQKMTPEDKAGNGVDSQIK